MSPSRTAILRTALEALHYSGAARVLAPVARGRGAIFMLHHVSPAARRDFEPNGMLTVTPEFLEHVVVATRAAGFDVVSLDEAQARMAADERPSRPFACFTADDGYRDNRDHALPVLRKHGVPLTIYVATDFADGRGFLWWLVLENVLRGVATLTVPHNDGPRTYRCDTPAAKQSAFCEIYWWLRGRPEPEARAVVAEMAAAAGLDPLAPCRELAMDWDELREIAADPLVTIGAHSISHHALSGLDAASVRAEIAGSVARIERELGRPCRHLCYPYGDAGSAGEREFAIAAELGLATAVTTRKGFIADRPGRLTGLPRVSLNGDYQSKASLEALLSGVPFLLWNALQPSQWRGRRPAGGARLPVPAHSG